MLCGGQWGWYLIGRGREKEMREGGGYRYGGVSRVGGNEECTSSIVFPKYPSAGLPIGDRTERENPKKRTK